MTVAIVVPVLGRPHRVQPLVDSIAVTTPGAEVLFVCDPGDVATQDAIAMAGHRMISPGGTYPDKIRAGIAATTAPLIFTGADDLVFHPGWLEAADAARRAHLAQVVGVNDLIPRRREHCTHFLLTRAYALEPLLDGEPGPFSSAYRHWFCDDELIATAKHRGVWAYAPDAHVEHLHPDAGTAPDDATYQAGRHRARLDRKTFNRRRHLWTSPS